MYVFLCTDAASNPWWVRRSGSRQAVIDALELAGLQIIEDQSDDYEGPVSEWDGTVTLGELQTHPDFTPHV